MSQRSKRELFAEVQPRYMKASKAGKQKILDEFTASTGYHRKYAIRLLKHGYRLGAVWRNRAVGSDQGITVADESFYN